MTYLGRKAFDENGHQQIEEDVVAERHQRNEVESRPMTRLLHSVE